MEDYTLNIGKRVTKCRIKSNNSNNCVNFIKNRKEHKIKPFKSGFKINTVKAVIDHPILHVPAYTFVEDDSYVECRRCEVVKLTEQQQKIMDLFTNGNVIQVMSIPAGTGKSNFTLIEKLRYQQEKKRTPKLSKFQIEMLRTLNHEEGASIFFNGTAYRTINILKSRGLIEEAVDKFYKITDMGVNELKQIRPL